MNKRYIFFVFRKRGLGGGRLTGHGNGGDAQIISGGGGEKRDLGVPLNTFDGTENGPHNTKGGGGDHGKARSV